MAPESGVLSRRQRAARGVACMKAGGLAFVNADVWVLREGDHITFTFCHRTHSAYPSI